MPRAGSATSIERNLIYDHDKTGIALVPFLEEGANDDLPAEDEWTQTCADQREQPLADEIPEQLLWEPYDNTIQRQRRSVTAAWPTSASKSVSEPTGGLGNCFSGNEHHLVRAGRARNARPVRRRCRASRRCGVVGRTIERAQLARDAESAPPSVDYEIAELPPIPDLDDMPEAATAPAEPATDMPRAVDVDAIVDARRLIPDDVAPPGRSAALIGVLVLAGCGSERSNVVDRR